MFYFRFVCPKTSTANMSDCSELTLNVLLMRRCRNGTRLFIRAPPTNVGEALLFSACPSIRPSVCLSLRCCGHSNFVIFNQISFKFHTYIASIKLCSSSNMGFGRRMITKMADKMAATYQFCCCGRSNLVIFNQISFKLYILCTISLAIYYVSHLFVRIFVQCQSISIAMKITGSKSNETTEFQTPSFK